METGIKNACLICLDLVAVGISEYYYLNSPVLVKFYFKENLMKQKGSIIERLRYRLDNLYSRNTGLTLFTLGLMTLLLALFATVILIAARLAPGNEESYTLIEAFWVSLLSAIGNGSIGGRESAWSYRLLMLAMTFGSIFIGSFFISALTNGLVSRVNELKRGRTRVIEEGHIVILGWSEQVFTILSELLIANESQAKACIVILGNLTKDDMEDQIAAKVTRVGKTRIVCRTGDPMEMADLNIVSLNTARTIIVLQTDSHYPDADVIKTILAITNHPKRRKEPYEIVSGIRNPHNLDIAVVAGRQEVQWLMTSETISRVIAQTSLQPGLSAIYDDLFDFADNDIYFKEEPRLVGETFSQALFASEHNSLIGICTKSGRVLLKPNPDYLIKEGDRLIVVASDDNLIRFDPQGQLPIQPEMISLGQAAEPQPKRILVLGWNWRGSRIIHELDYYVPQGSEVTVVADHDKIEETIERECRQLGHSTVSFFPGDTDDRQILEGILFKPYDHVIILGYSDKLSSHRADAKTLVTLLHLRDIKERDKLGFTVVTEMMDIRNYELASTARADDYVVSERIISLLMSQIAENKQLSEAFIELLNPQSSEIYLKPVSLYVKTGQPVNFYTVLEAACQRGEIAFGFRIAADSTNPVKAFGIVLNPLKSAEVNFTAADKIIVLAES